jgi:hypothetical protein
MFLVHGRSCEVVGGGVVFSSMTGDEMRDSVVMCSPAHIRFKNFYFLASPPHVGKPSIVTDRQRGGGSC